MSGYVALAMHTFLGWSWDEWASVIVLLSTVGTAFVWLIKRIVIDPLTTSINLLSKKVDGIGGNADLVHKNHEDRLDDHDRHLDRHDEQIKTLFNDLEDHR